MLIARPTPPIYLNIENKTDSISDATKRRSCEKG